MEKEFVPFNESLELKQLGFDEPCFGAWAEHGFMTPNDVSTLQDDVTIEDIENTQDENMCLSPLYQQAFRWFREKYNYDIVVSGFYNSGKKYFYRIETAPTIGLQSFGGDYRTYEKAELACLRKLIELVKNK